ncbi:MAG: hypothetical protein U9R57_02345 [Thermodesulfobacteriota bacterium]|nr:hypothetical protein [Thermodesulfobacteriota bacterium]
MQKIISLVFASILCTFNLAQSTTLTTSFESLNFNNSKKKDEGIRYRVGLDYQRDKHFFQMLYGRTNTSTFQPPLSDDLHVNKVYLKYRHQWHEKQSFHISYATIDDNLMKETDGGDIYGAGYGYGPFDITQYLSAYKHFDVYQTDIKYTLRKKFNNVLTKATVIGKYLHLENKNSNNFSRNADDDYFTAGLKLHAKYNKFHLGAGAFWGKRIFAVMNDGFRVQHHAMEFNKTYMFGMSRQFGKADLKLRYIYQEATEVPIQNDNVTLSIIILQLRYEF